MFAQAGKEKTTVHKEHLIESVSFYRYEKGKKGWRRTAIFTSCFPDIVDMHF